MMPDLGKYALEVLASYVASLALIAVLVGLSLRRARKVRDALNEVEARRRKDG
ncbi:heme exporter protein CcmD [Roseovarius sp. E0-M6]|uniref:heme exporter protein CcmD n=1 Tax=Roseovarius sp. E0-M6 TaxID=3127118 RepID=UPI00300FC37D